MAGLERLLAIGLLATAALTDLARRRIYRAWSATALGSGLALALVAGRWSHVVIALALFGATYLLWSRGGLGGGDVWLAVYLGLVLGMDALVALLLGACLASVVAVVLVAAKKLTWKDPVPLGLFWCLGGLAVLVVDVEWIVVLGEMG